MGVTSWLRCMNDTWKGVLALAAAVAVGAGITSSVASFRGLPEGLQALEEAVALTAEQVSTNTTRLDRLEEIFKLQTCLQVADRDPAVHWEECLQLYPESRRLLRQWQGREQP